MSPSRYFIIRLRQLFSSNVKLCDQAKKNVDTTKLLELILIFEVQYFLLYSFDMSLSKVHK